MPIIQMYIVEEIFQAHLPLGLFSIVKIISDSCISPELISKLFQNKAHNEKLIHYLSKFTPWFSLSQRETLKGLGSENLIVPLKNFNGTGDYLFCCYDQQLEFETVIVCDNTVSFSSPQYFANFYLNRN